MNSQFSARARDHPTEDSASFDALIDTPGHPSAPKTPKEQGETLDIAKTIVFVNHVHDRYVWPYDLAHSHETVKRLIEEVYASSQYEAQRNALSKGKYDIRTEDGAIILPSVWQSIVQPFSTISITFWDDIGRFERVYDDITEPPVERPPPVRYRSVEAIEVAAGADESEEDLDSTSTNETDEEVGTVTKQPEPQRNVTSATDSEGNKLAYGIDTRYHGPATSSSNEGSSDTYGESNKPPEGLIETLKITKAMALSIDNKTMICISTLPGPETLQLRDSVTVTWYHLQAKQLNFMRFRQACLDLPHLSRRLHTLTRDLLAKIEKHKVKTYLDGLYVEPGTVMRVDERCQPDPESVIFSCIPYYDLQEPLANKPTPGLQSRLYSPRTLMQAAYPYEPVRERDAEQAYRKYGDTRSKKLIYVPNLWMLNLGANVVVTCGHRPLAMELIKSIEVAEEDVQRLGEPHLTKDTLTSIRLTDWNGQAHIYSLLECRTYFQMEQKLRELRKRALETPSSESLHMSDGTRLVTPKDWPSIILRTDRIFIDLASLADGGADRKLQSTAEASTLPALSGTQLSSLAHTNIQADKVKTPAVSLAEKPSQIASPSTKPVSKSTSNSSISPGRVPPFFHWSTAEVEGSEDAGQDVDLTPVDVRHASQWLQIAAKSMASAALDSGETTNQVDESFTSTVFFETLSEDKQGHIDAQFNALASMSTPKDTQTYHAAFVGGQCASILEKSRKFCATAQATVQLFVRDADEGILLPKLWGAMSNIHALVTRVSESAIEAVTQAPSHTRHTGRHVRINKQSQPKADKAFARSLRRCRRCQSLYTFETNHDAIEHLRSHLRSQAQVTPLADVSQNVAQPFMSEESTELNLEDWIVDTPQLKRETLNGAVLQILTLACDDSLVVFQQLEELADGVRMEDGSMSELYTFPRNLVETFRSLVVFYLAIERALHYTEDSIRDDDARPSHAHHVETSLLVLKRFVKGVQRSADMAHDELCSMVKSDNSADALQSLSLGSHYMCGWLMRRLLVKPLDRHMAIPDMYREYLTTIQFQVNHRPGKRLLRSINLLQEELQVLVQVNAWQRNLIGSYLTVLNDATYEKHLPSRRANFQHERVLLQSCAEQLALSLSEITGLVRRCGPLSDSTKQSLEINEEDHGKAIMVFTVVTIIFLPLSFVTSFFGMNTNDIRDMASGQSLFWAVAIPLTAVTMGAAMFISYNGDNLRDGIASIYHLATGKPDRNLPASGIATAQWKRARPTQSDSNADSDITPADDAEYAIPWVGDWLNRYDPTSYRDGRRIHYHDVGANGPRLRVDPRTLRYAEEDDLLMYRPPISYQQPPPPPPPPQAQPYDNIPYAEGARERFRPGHIAVDDDEWYDSGRHRRPDPRMHQVDPYSDRRYDEYDASPVQAYTWHKRTRRQRVADRRAHGDGGGRRYEGYGVEPGGGVRGYGVGERHL